MSFISKYTTCCPECNGSSNEYCPFCFGCGITPNKNVDYRKISSLVKKIIKIKEGRASVLNDRKRVLSERLEISQIKTASQQNCLENLCLKTSIIDSEIKWYERFLNAAWINSVKPNQKKLSFVIRENNLPMMKEAKHGVDIGPQLRQIINEVTPRIIDATKKLNQNLLGRKKQYVVWSGTVRMPLSPKHLKSEYLVIKVVWDVTSPRRASLGYYAVEEMPVEKRYYNVVVVNAASVGTDTERIESVLTHEISHAADPKKYHQHFIEGVEEAALKGDMKSYHSSNVEFDAYTGDIIERIRRIVDTLAAYSEHKEKLHNWLSHILICLRKGDLGCALEVVSGTTATGFVFAIDKIEPLKRLAIQRIATVVQESFRKLDKKPKR